MTKRKLVNALLVITLVVTLIPFVSQPVRAAGGTYAAERLYALGLFQGVGDNADGTPNFALDRVPTRHEAVTMLVRLLGQEEAAKNETWTTPFTDVAEWAKPYVGYAYTTGLTTGTSATTYGGYDTITASQYLTFVLRALGYTSGSDFAWDSAWVLSDELGFTNGEYNASTRSFTRGDIAAISLSALTATYKDSDMMLYERLIDNGAITREAATSNITLPLYINGRKVISVQSFYRMTMGGVRSECQGNNTVAELYNFLQNNTGREVAAPDMFGDNVYLDAPVYYRMTREISFMATSGLDGIVVQTYRIYTWLNAGYPNVSLPLGSLLIYDATHDKWYQFTTDDELRDLDRIYELGNWVEIYNNVA